MGSYTISTTIYDIKNRKQENYIKFFRLHKIYFLLNTSLPLLFLNTNNTKPMPNVNSLIHLKKVIISIQIKVNLEASETIELELKITFTKNI